MYEPNVERILALLSPADIVLDIGGWACPLNRANYVMDAEPYETRGYYGGSNSFQGDTREFFAKDTWIQRDICERTPFPFRDKEIDFVICSHTLEDIRDPLWVCSEMIRIAKRGYIEVPSRLAESCRGVERNQVGWSHHRWLVEINGNQVCFLMKYHMIHSHWRFSLPDTYLKRMSREQQVQWLFWEDSFDYGEKTIHGVENIAAELEHYVQKTDPYPEWRMSIDRKSRWLRSFSARAFGKVQRTLKFAQ